MQQKTKTKMAKAKVAIQKAGRTFWGWVPILAAETAVFLGIDAWVTAHRNEKKLNKLTDRVKENFRIQDHNWNICDMDHKVLLEMTKDNDELLEKALGVTVGEAGFRPEEKKEEPAA